ncbi:hypothetical protein ACFWN2_45085 [Lentzea sp. NPDC058436]|uniref:hypothetical protein n=1 Tax=Lentzea sp. NPDC058436 TaxID=3346499 RepID=UPI003647CB0A
MSFAVLLGAVLGSAAIKSGALIAAVLLITITGIALVANNATERRELEKERALLARYCNQLDKTRPGYQILEWKEKIVIGERGDAHSKLTIRLRPLGPDLLFVRVKFGCGWPQQPRYRRQVKMTVRNLLVDGSPGTTLHQTLTWPKDGVLDAVIHFHEAPSENAEISFGIELDWPKRCLPLIEGSPDEFAFMFAQPVTDAVYRVVLPRGHDVYLEPIGRLDEGFELDKAWDDDERRTVTLMLTDPPLRHRAGARLELRRGQRTISRD